MHDTTTLVLACVASFFVGVLLSMVAKTMLLTPWLRAFLSGGQVRGLQIVTMRLRGVPVAMILDAYLSRVQAGKKTSLRVVESAYIANKHKIQSVADLLAFVEQNSPE